MSTRIPWPAATAGPRCDATTAQATGEVLTDDPGVRWTPATYARHLRWRLADVMARPPRRGMLAARTELLARDVGALNGRVDALLEAMRLEVEGAAPEPAYRAAAAVQARRRQMHLVSGTEARR